MKVRVVDEQGRSGLVNQEDLDEVQASGWRVADDAEAKTIQEKVDLGEQDITTAAEQFADTATFGLYGVAASKLAPEYYRRMETREEVNPNAATFGTVAGYVAPALLSGGTGALATASKFTAGGAAATLGRAAGSVAGKAIPKAAGQVAATIGQMAAVGAAENMALQGAELVQDAVQGREVVFDKAASQVVGAGLQGALLGAGFGLGTMAVGSAAKGLATAAKKGLEKSMPDNATAAAKALSLTNKQALKFKDSLDDFADVLSKPRDELGGTGIVSGNRMKQVENFEKVRSTVGKAIGDANKELDQLAKAHNITVNTKDVAAKAYKFAASEAEQFGERTALSALKRLSKEVESMGDEVSFGALTKKIQRVQNELSPKFSATRDNATSTAMKKYLSGLKDQRDNIGRAIEQASGREGILATLDDLRSEYALLKKMGTGSGEKARGVIYSAAAKDRSVLSELSPGRLMSNSDTAFTTGSLVSGDPTAFLAKQGFDVVRSAANKYGPELALKMKAAQKFNTLVNKTDTILDTAVDNFVRSASKAGGNINVTIPAISTGMKVRNMDMETLNQVADKVQYLAQSPEEHIDRITNDLRGMDQYHPAAMSYITQSRLAAMNFLASKVPPTMQSLSPTPLATKKRRKESELKKFQRYYVAVMDPLSVISKVPTGKVSTEEVEALKAVYPHLYKDLGEKMALRVSTMETPLPYSKRSQLSILYGVPMDATHSPQFVQRMQSTFADDPTDGQGGGGTRVTGIEKITAGQDAMTQSQRLQQGD